MLAATTFELGHNTQMQAMLQVFIGPIHDGL